MQLVLIRHGQTEWNVRGQIQGHLDTKLNSTGKKQAKRILNSLNSLNVSQINKIYSGLAAGIDIGPYAIKKAKGINPTKASFKLNVLLISGLRGLRILVKNEIIKKIK